MDGYFDTRLNDGHPSYLEIEARVKKFKVAGVETSVGTCLNGRFRGGEDGIDFDGEAHLSGRYIAVTGNVDSSGNGNFEGSFGEKYGARVGPKGCRARWSVEYTLTAGFSFGQDTDVNFDVDARACVGGCGIGNNCSSIGGSATFMDDGRIKVCAQVPSFGKKCDRF